MTPSARSWELLRCVDCGHEHARRAGRRRHQLRCSSFTAGVMCGGEMIVLPLTAGEETVDPARTLSGAASRAREQRDGAADPVRAALWQGRAEGFEQALEVLVGTGIRASETLR